MNSKGTGPSGMSAKVNTGCSGRVVTVVSSTGSSGNNDARADDVTHVKGGELSETLVSSCETSETLVNRTVDNINVNVNLQDQFRNNDDQSQCSDGDDEVPMPCSSRMLLQSCEDPDLDDAVVYLRSQWVGAVNSLSSGRKTTTRTPNQDQSSAHRNRLLRVTGTSKGTPCRILIDRGSEVNVCSLEFARLVGISLPEEQLESMDFDTPLGGKGGVSVYQDIVVRIIIAGWGFSGKFLVTRLDNYDFILGAPWCYDWNPAIDNRLCSVTIKSTSGIVRFIADEDFERSNVCYGLNALSKSKGQRLIRKKQGQGYMVRVTDSAVKAVIERNGVSTKLKVHDDRYKPLLDKYGDVFPDELPDGLPPVRGEEHEINLVPNAELPRPRGMRLSHAMLMELQKQIRRLLDLGLIRPSKSPVGAGVFFVGKPDGTFRLICDWRGLNAITIKDATCVPHADDLFDELGPARVFSILDQWSGFNQVRMRESDIWKTAMKTPMGNFEWLVMGFGLSNAPATFQRLMTTILRQFLGKSVVVFQDDLVVYSNSHEEHMVHLEQVLEALRGAQLYAKPSKCTIGSDSVKFLGHVISHGKIGTDPEKISAVNDMTPPGDVHGVRRFLGFANWFRRFVPHFSELALPLHNLTRKHATFQWGIKEQTAFDSIKTYLVSAPVLRLPDVNRQFVVQTDASEQAVGGALMQVDDDGHEYVVAYRSEKLPTLKQAWPTHDRELYAVVSAVTRWKHYLEGSHFVVQTDHRPLLHIMTQKELTNKQIRWVTKLADYDFEMVYRPGTQMGVADCLSRPTQVNNLVFRNKCAVSYDKDPYYKNITLGTTRFQKQSDGALMLVEQDKQARLCVPTPSLQREIMTEYHTATYAAHPGRDRMFEAISKTYYWHEMRRDVAQYVKHCQRCQRSKPRNAAAAGKPMPLDPPDGPWEDISIDFMTDLPTTQRGCDMLMVVVDRFSKMAHLTACKKSNTSEQVAKLMVRDIFRLHGIPKSVVSDRDPRFTSDMWQAFWKQLGTKLSMSTADHPQTDGQTEVVNRSINWMFRTVLESPGPSWDELLPLLEFSHNSMVTRTTGLSPFEVVYGRRLVTPATMMSSDNPQPDASSMIEQLELVRGKLLQAQALMEVQSTVAHSGVLFKEGDQVLVSASRVHGGPSQRTSKGKWQELWRGPFTVNKVVNENAYGLEMPEWFNGYPVFNIEYLKQWYQDDHDDQIDATVEVSDLGQLSGQASNRSSGSPVSTPPRRSGRAVRPSQRLKEAGDG